MNSSEEESFPDFSNLLLLAECACADLPSSSPPCKKLRGPGPPSSSPPCKRLRGSGSPSSSPPCKKLRGPGPSSSSPPPSSSLPCKKLRGPGPPSSSLAYKKLRGPGLPSSSLAYKKLRGPEPPTPIGWLEAHVRLKGTTPICFGQKLLTPTDIKDHFNRLAIPKEMISRIMAASVMTKEEKAKVTSTDDGLPVVVLDRMGQTWRLVFKYWWSSKTYVMNGEWKQLVKENGLRAKIDQVHLWAFRAVGPSGPLRFVLA